MTIPKGLHRIKDAEYFAIDLPSSSATKKLLTQTNAHLAHERANPKSDDSPALAIGALVHAIVLQPESIVEDFIRVGRIDRRTKEGKARVAAVQSWRELISAPATARSSREGSVRGSTRPGGSRILTDDEWREAEAIADGVLQGPSIARALLGSLTDREVTVIGEIDGKPAKAKMDGLVIDPRDNSVVVVDLKTAQDASPSAFASACAKFGYAHQQAWYSALLESLGYDVTDFVFVAVEKAAPHLTALYRIDDFAIEVARKKMINLCRRWWQVSEGNNEGYPQVISTVEMPKWWLND